MKFRLSSLVAALGLLGCLSASAGVTVNRAPKLDANQQVYIDMAVSAAKTSVAEGDMPTGAVVILGGAWRGTGTAMDGRGAEATAIAKARTKTLGNATLYTMIQPTSAACAEIAKSGIQQVYFVIDADQAIKAGIHKASDFTPAADVNLTLTQLPYPAAQKVVSDWQKGK